MKFQQLWKRRLLFIAGTLSMGVGILGILIPILPTTPFLLIAAACYIRSSQKFYNWLLNNRILGVYISNYMQGKGIPLKVKMFTVTLLWLTIGISVCFFAPNVIIRVILILIAVGVTVHIIRKKTFGGK
ncbi:YbaN family protein [Chloroflexota bacterium]